MGGFQDKTARGLPGARHHWVAVATSEVSIASPADSESIRPVRTARGGWGKDAMDDTCQC